MAITTTVSSLPHLRTLVAGLPNPRTPDFRFRSAFNTQSSDPYTALPVRLLRSFAPRAAWRSSARPGYNHTLFAPYPTHPAATQMAMEFGTTGRLVESTAAAVRFGVESEDAVAKLVKLCERFEALEAVVQVGKCG